MAILLLFAFLSGLVTIAAPCIWPLLPSVLSTSSLSGRRRPLGLTLGILVSFGVLTLSLSYLVHLIGLDASMLRSLAVVVLAAIGAMLLWPALGRQVEARISRVTGSANRSHAGEGFWPGFVSGLPLGVVWAPCAGPIFATIATLAATREVGFSIVLVTLAYLVGVGIPLFGFALAGQRFVRGSRALSRHTGALQRVFGLAIVLTAVLILFDWDTRLQARLLSAVPSYQRLLNDLEGSAGVTKELNRLRGTEPLPVARGANPMFNADAPAPEFKGIEAWLNLPAGSSSLTLEQLRGKVVLIDFWTYTCINCIRTLPHLKAWHEEYADDGLVIVGVHSPEFAFERSTSNVEAAIQRFGIRYPVAQDNDFATWKAYRNQYWPAHYLIDREGKLRRIEFGEGSYDETEMAIRELLKEAGAKITTRPTTTPDATPTELSTPETFLGSDRMINFFPTARLEEGEHRNLEINPAVSRNTFTLAGDWLVQPEYAETLGGSVLDLNFHGRYVYLVMHAPDAGSGTIRVLLDGVPAGATNAGADVRDGIVTVDSDRLYELIDQRTERGQRRLRLELSPGIQLYAFTFG